MRTVDEVLARLKLVKSSDTFGFASEVLIRYGMSGADAERAGYAPLEPWPPPSHEALQAETLGYLAFAWDKALNHRGLSASRSVQKMTEFLWLLGHDADVLLSDVAYPQYGAPILKRCAEVLGQSVPESPFLVRMMQGLPCREGCEMGCAA